MEKTAWRKTIDPNYIGTYVLPDDKPIDVVITRVEWKNTKVMGQEKKASIAYFAPNKYFDKPMLLNVTNMKRLERITGSKYIEDWVNVSITLQREMDKTPTGQRDWALRIAPIAPKTAGTTKIKLEPTSGNWNSIVDWVQKGNPIEKGWEKYDVSDEDKEKLKNESNAESGIRSEADNSRQGTEAEN